MNLLREVNNIILFVFDCGNNVEWRNLVHCYFLRTYKYSKECMYYVMLISVVCPWFAPVLE
jgi:hypothetical protein